MLWRMKSLWGFGISSVLNSQIKRIGIFIICAFSVVFVPSESCAQSSTERLSLLISIHQPENTPLYRWMSLLYHDLFSRVGYSIRLIYLPPQRATSYAEIGELDGQVGRMATYAAHVANQIKVNETIYTIDMVAYVRTSSGITDLNGWGSLVGKDLKIDYLRGISIAEKNLTPLVPAEDLGMVNDLTQGFLRLKEKRSDVFIASHYIAEPLLATLEYGQEISQGGVLVSVGFYPHLHVRHDALVPLLEATLQEMKKEGLIEKYRQQALQ